MDAIARHADVSKATLYAHFASKEALFVAVMQSVKNDYQEQLEYTSSTADGDFAARLTAVGLFMMQFFVSPWALQMFQVIITQRERFPDVVSDAMSQGRVKAKNVVTGVFQSGVESGELIRHDCAQSAQLFMSILRGGLLWETLTDCRTPHGQTEIRERVEMAVNSMIRIYAVSGASEPR